MKKALYLIPFLITLFVNIVFADIISPSLGLYLLKELSKSKSRIFIFILVITVIGILFDMVLENVAFPGFNIFNLIIFLISVLLFMIYTVPLSKFIIPIPFKKALLIGLMIGILTNPL